MTGIEDALEVVRASGYVVVKAKSYRAAQRRQGHAQSALEWAEQRAASAEQWARNCLHNERRMGERLTFVYGVARAKGATDDELKQTDLPDYLI